VTIIALRTTENAAMADGDEIVRSLMRREFFDRVAVGAAASAIPMLAIGILIGLLFR